MEESIYHFLLYYFSGVLTYRLAAGAFRVAEYSESYGKVEISALKIYRALDHDMVLTMKMKYRSMKDSGVDEDRILAVAKKDQNVLTMWRETAIKNMVNAAPSSIVRVNRYRTWNEAMNRLKKEEANER